MERKFWHSFTSTATKEFIEEGRRTSGYSRFDTLHGYVYGRWPYLYIGIGTGEHWIARFFGPIYRMVLKLIPSGNNNNGSQITIGDHEPLESGTFADGYHGKVVPLDAATQLVSVNEDIRIMDLEKVGPYVTARDIILHNPDHILALECPCRSARSRGAARSLGRATGGAAGPRAAPRTACGAGSVYTLTDTRVALTWMEDRWS